MSLKDKLTIVIPCKNEERYIGNLLHDLHEQEGIDGVKIVIADASTDSTPEIIDFWKETTKLNITVVEGGPVSTAKNNGANIVSTPYMVFIDADVQFFSNTVLVDSVRQLQEWNLDLVGLKMKCYDGNIITQMGFTLFNIINAIMSRWIPFAVGAFFLTRTDKFRELGGFPDKYNTSEDFILSRMYSPSKFAIGDHYFGQDSRRMKKMGYFGMAWYLIKNFINRNNEEYWSRIDNSYWE